MLAVWFAPQADPWRQSRSRCYRLTLHLEFVGRWCQQNSCDCLGALKVEAWPSNAVHLFFRFVGWVVLHSLPRRTMENLLATRAKLLRGEGLKGVFSSLPSDTCAGGSCTVCRGHMSPSPPHSWRCRTWSTWHSAQLGGQRDCQDPVESGIGDVSYPVVQQKQM